MLDPLIATHVLADHHWDGPGPWALLLWLPLWAVVLWAIRSRRPGRGGGEFVLAERYARGEIDEAEYRSRRATLRGRA